MFKIIFMCSNDNNFFRNVSRFINTNINPLYFDNSVFDIYSTIPFAKTLVFYDLDLKSTINVLYEDFYNFHYYISN